MGLDPHLDLSPVYHDPEPETPLHCHLGDDDTAAAPSAPPRLIALCLACPDDTEDVAGDTLFDPDEVIAWGIAYADEAIVHMRDPETGRRDFGVFRSAEQARAFYSRFGPLRLVYL